MSDSELSDAPPTVELLDTELEKALRAAVTKSVKKGETLSVNEWRKKAEEDLNLDEGFFTSTKWKQRSKDIIRTHFETETNKDEDVESEQDSEVKPKRGKKRSSPAYSAQPRKKAKSAADDDRSAHSDTSVDKNTKKKGSSKTTSARIVSAQDASPDANDSDSALSSLIDEEPAVKKPKTSKATKSSGSHAKAKTTTKTAKAPPDSDPDTEEIKKLQSWLVKCGIRKVWGAYLKPYETPKAKIKHLKEMLADVGMTGRYSNEKAAQIKESRELAADIEAVQEGNERWGMDGDEDAADDDAASGPRNSKRLVRGAKHFDFLSSDGEETD